MISCSKTSATIRKTFKTKPPLEALPQTPPRESLPWNPIPQKHEMFLQKYKGSREILYLIFDYPHKHYTFKYFEV